LFEFRFIGSRCRLGALTPLDHPRNRSRRHKPNRYRYVNIKRVINSIVCTDREWCAWVILCRWTGRLCLRKFVALRSQLVIDFWCRDGALYRQYRYIGVVRIKLNLEPKGRGPFSVLCELFAVLATFIQVLLATKLNIIVYSYWRVSKFVCLWNIESFNCSFSSSWLVTICTWLRDYIFQKWGCYAQY